MKKNLNKTFSLKELASLTGATLKGDPNYFISGVDALETATESDLSFLANPRYMNAMKHSSAGAICVHSNHSDIEGKNLLISASPSHTFQKIVEAFFPDPSISEFHGIHETAVIHPTAKIHKDVHIGPYVVIDAEVEILEKTFIGSFVYIGPNVRIGSECFLHPHSIVRERCSLGNRVILQPGAVIGSCGFGYLTNAQGNHEKLQQLGIVIIEDDVEIGANTTIDRARFKTTYVRKGTKIDNLVQIAHNVDIGEGNLIAAQTGIAGSAKTGKHVFMGGQTGIVGHLEIADNTMIATRGGVSKSLPQSGKYAGSPVMSLSDYNRQQVLLRKIETFVEKIEELEKRIQELEKNPKAL